jgi:hypothetical protein
MISHKQDAIFGKEVLKELPGVLKKELPGVPLKKQDANFVKDVLKELPGVDATDARILSMLDRFLFYLFLGSIDQTCVYSLCCTFIFILLLLLIFMLV